VRHKRSHAIAARTGPRVGDGGPGNSGGFGCKPRGLNLASYEGVTSGLLSKSDGRRASVFRAGMDGVPLLLKALLNRHTEAAGAETGSVAFHQLKHRCGIGETGEPSRSVI
jgi:hypothetical protein